MYKDLGAARAASLEYVKAVDTSPMCSYRTDRVYRIAPKPLPPVLLKDPGR